MWECDGCGAAAAGMGYRQAVTELEAHLAHGCRSGWYSYGHGWREKVTCRVSREPDGRYVHEALTG